MTVEEAYEHILNGDGLLFCGSGFSWGATNIKDSPVLIGSGLIEHFKKILDEEDTDLAYLSEIYCDRYGKESLVNLLKDNYTIKDFCSHHKVISELSWRRIYTTNYDNLIEVSSAKVRRKTVGLCDNPSDFKNPREIVVHLNGSIDNIDENKLNKEIKLTNISYVSENFLDSKWSGSFIDHLHSCKVIIFIGFSLNYDLDIKRAMFVNEEIREKTFFINGKELDRKSQYTISKYGQILLKDSSEFADDILTFEKQYEKPTGYVHPIYALKEFKAPRDNYEIVTESDIVDLLVHGTFDKNLFFHNSIDGKYIFYRTDVDRIIEEIKNGINIVVINSDLGNGKSLLLEHLKLKLLTYGSVFEVISKDEDYEKDLDIIINNYKGKKFLIVEHYNNYIKFLEKLNYFKLNDVVVVLTARKYIHDLMFSSLLSLEYYKAEKMIEVNVDTLRHAEVCSIIKLMDRHNLWQEFFSPFQSARRCGRWR